MKVAGYIRVSTDEQASHGVSLAMQERRVMGYCMAKDWDLIEVVRDEGRSAKDLNRPGVQCLREMVDQRAVVFQKWRWPCLHCPSKGIAVDKQANDDVVHLCRFRKADGLADQAFNARP